MPNILHKFNEPLTCPQGRAGEDPDDIPCMTCRHFLGTEQPSGELAFKAEIIKCAARGKKR